MNGPTIFRWAVALALCAAAFYLGTLTGCTAEAHVVEPHARCNGIYAMTPDGHHWYLDCVNSVPQRGPDNG